NRATSVVDKHTGTYPDTQHSIHLLLLSAQVEQLQLPPRRVPPLRRPLMAEPERPSQPSPPLGTGRPALRRRHRPGADCRTVRAGPGGSRRRLGLEWVGVNPAPGAPRGYRNGARQFLMFGIVGGSGMVVNMIVTVVMNNANGGTQNAQDILFPFPGTEFNFRFTTLVWIVAFLVANLYNFLLNRHWTFGKGHKAPFWHEFWPFLLVGSVAAAAGIFIKLTFTNPTSPLYLPEPLWHEDAGIH